MEAHQSNPEKPLSALEFAWHRSSADRRQFVLINGRMGNQPAHFKFIGRDTLDALEVYHPFQDEPDLYLKFAKLGPSPSPASLVDFANLYGQLGIAREFTPYDGGLDAGEMIGNWRSAIDYVRLALRLCELIQEHKLDELSHFIEWSKRGIVLRYLTKGGEITGAAHRSKRHAPALPVVTALTNADLIGRWKEGAIEGPAKACLAHLINCALDGKTRSKLVVDKGNNLVSRESPANLLAAIWVQIYQLAIGVRRVKRCELCDLLMDVTDSRSHKRVHKHCSQKERSERWAAEQRKKNGKTRTK